jgi:hypothetical protein
MNDKKEWQEANRELIAEERRRLGDPPTVEEMLAYTRGELSEAEEERIQDLLVVYPELARMYCEPFPEEPRPGDSDHVSEAQVAAGWNALQQRLRPRGDTPARDEAQRGRVLSMRYVPTAVAAMVAVVFFGLFVQSEFRARHYAREARQPHIPGAPQELVPDGNRGAGAPTLLSRDGEAYLLRPHLINQLKYPHYRLELHDAQGAAIWTNAAAKPDDDDAETFQIVVPHAFLAEGEKYQLRIFGVDSETQHLLGTYDLGVPAE